MNATARTSVRAPRVAAAPVAPDAGTDSNGALRRAEAALDATRSATASVTERTAARESGNGEPDADRTQAARETRIARLMEREGGTTPRAQMSAAARVTGQEGPRGPAGFDDWFYSQRAYPARSIPAGARAAALRQATRNSGQRGGLGDPASPFGPPTLPGWTPIGPSTLPDGQTDTGAGPALSPVSGRVSAIAVDPSNPSVVYVGGAQGGVWKTTNATAASPTWTPLTDHQLSLAIGWIAVDPVNTNILYAGTGEPNGSCDSYYGRGILRSADGGATWIALGTGAGGPFDGQSISRILIDPVTAGSATTTTLWASTARAALSSGTEQCQLAPEAWNGAVWRSTDSGATWNLQNVPTGAVAPNARIHDMVLDPSNSNNLYVAVRANGVWKSTNANAAIATFTKLAGGLPDFGTSNPVVLRSSLAIAGSGSPGTLYLAAEANTSNSALFGVFKTINGGTTWSHVDGGANGTCNVTGARTITVVSGSAPAASMVGHRIIINGNISRTVASVNTVAGTITTQLSEATLPAGLTGVSFSVGSYPTYCDNQCLYDMTVAVDPTDATGSRVYVGGNPHSFNTDLASPPGAHTLWRSDDGGTTWRGISQGDGIAGGLHADDHAIAFDASTNPARVYDGNDGGIGRSDNQGGVWTSMNTNLAITQFQSVGLHPADTNIVIGGTQDNGTNIRNPALQPVPAWFHSDFGDGGQSFIDQSTPARMFHTYFNQSFSLMGPAKTINGGASGSGSVIFGGSWDFVGTYFGYGVGYYNGLDPTDPVSFYAPIAAHPAFTPNVVYFGSNKLYRSPDPQIPCCPTAPIGGCGVTCTNPGSWTVKSPALSAGFLSAIGVFPTLMAGKEIIYTGGSDGRISVSSTVDGTATVPTWTTISGVAPLPNRFVTEIEVATSDPTGNTAYVAFSGFNQNTPTRPGHLFGTTNGLAPTPSWTDVSGDLPDIPVNAIAIDPTRTPNLLYAGTDIGVFESVDGGAHWTYISTGHPVVAVFGLDRNPNTGQIVSSTHGRGMFQLVNNDTTSPACTGVVSGSTRFDGSARDEALNDTGIASVSLQPGSTNLVISSINFLSPTAVTYVVTLINGALPGSGTVRIRDYAGNFCDTAISLIGSPSLAGNFFTITPCRLTDTRAADAPALAAGADRTFFVAGNCGIPSSATSISANVTVTEPTSMGDIRAFAGGTPLPETSVVNFRPGQTRANNAIIQLGPGGTVTVHDDQAGGNTVHFILDVNGYFQ